MMAKANKTQQTQIDKFKEAARELQTDDSEKAFDAIVKKIAKSPQPNDDKPIKQGRAK